MSRAAERRLAPPPSVRSAGGSAAGPKTIEGLAAVYYTGAAGTEFVLWDDGPGGERAVEHVMPGAFDRAIREDDVRALFNHEADKLLGRTRAGTLRLKSTAAGLHYSIDPPDTQLARDLMVWLRRGDVTGSSFSFSVEQESWSSYKRDGGGVLYVRELRGLRLYDVGPVTFPAYAGSTAGGRGVVLPARPAAPKPATPAPRRKLPDRIAARLRVLAIDLNT